MTEKCLAEPHAAENAPRSHEHAGSIRRTGKVSHALDLVRTDYMPVAAVIVMRAKPIKSIRDKFMAQTVCARAGW
jgi:hypothetical protein